MSGNWIVFNHGVANYYFGSKTESATLSSAAYVSPRMTAWARRQILSLRPGETLGYHQRDVEVRLFFRDSEPDLSTPTSGITILGRVGS